MKKVLPLLLMFLSIHCLSQTREFTGSWMGTLNVGVKLRILFHFTKNPDGTYTGTTDSPDQGVKGMSLSEVTPNGLNIKVKMNQQKAEFKGTLTNDTSITGTFAQGAYQLPLTLIKITKLLEASRPQTPRPPFAYNSEDVEYGNSDRSVHFGATLTYPKSGSPFTTILLISGSGQQDRDETIFEHKPFAVIADYLTNKGYAVLRIDDRGIGKTTGDVKNATSADFAKDVEAGIRYLKSRKEVDAKKIGLLGHSEGGMIAPMVASKNKEVNFIILWGAAIVGGSEVNTAQNAYSLKKAGINEAGITAFKQLHERELSLFAKGDDLSKLNNDVMKVFQQWKSKQPVAVLKTLFVTDSSIVGQKVETMYDVIYQLPWMRYFISHNFTADLAGVKCPVLAINGDKDTQVDAKRNLEVIDSILRANNNRSVKTVALKGLNHLLQTANTGDVNEYRVIEETIAPEALKTIGTWLDETVKRK